ncbi:MAG: GlsB/YeaQ/YmgE family stress response membrane protein [Candidatus Omnitrophica bacterium]|nr:GlsB/YeaQ/YmgE family stress response membrane protein [Candidatus Omnitrophota bacterium]
MENLVWFLLIGLLVGWLAGVIMKGHGFGLFGNIGVGVVGALLGGWLAGATGLVSYSALGGFVTALIGAVVLVGVIGLLQRA